MKKTIFLAGDSTMQAYSDTKRPQYGWGEVLYKYLDDTLVNVYHRDNSPHEQQKCFECENLIFDNCAMAGRSTKSFTDEERHIDLFYNSNHGDRIIIQFGHNDVAKDKPERYVPIEKLNDYFDIFIKKSRLNKIKPIILSPILIDIYSNDNEILKTMVDDLKKYIVEIEKIADTNNIPFIKVGSIAKNKIATENIEISELYLEDHVHLNQKGAEFYASIIATEIKYLI